MARTVRALATPAATELKLSQVASVRVRRLLGNVKPGARLGQKPGEGIGARRTEAHSEDREDTNLFSENTRGVTKERPQPGLESGVSPDAEEIHQQPSLSPSHLQKTSSKKIPPSLEEVESPSQPDSLLPNKPLSLESGPSAGAIGLDSPVPSPFFSFPSPASNEGVKKFAITPPALRIDGTGNPAMLPTGLKTPRLAGRKCLITGATSGIGNHLSL